MLRLSTLAKEFLASTKRVASVPTADLRPQIEEAIGTCDAVESWLAFHEQFAGYVHDFGHGDWVIWGLAHKESHWQAPGLVEISFEEQEGKGEPRIRCAESHPSYAHELLDSGEFWSPPAENFGVHVERTALLWSLDQRSELHGLCGEELRDPKMLSEWNCATENPEATDRFTRYLGSEHFLVIWHRDMSAPSRGWRF